MSIDKMEQLQVRVENVFFIFGRGSRLSRPTRLHGTLDVAALWIVFSDFMTKIIEHWVILSYRSFVHVPRFLIVEIRLRYRRFDRHMWQFCDYFVTGSFLHLYQSRSIVVRNIWICKLLGNYVCLTIGSMNQSRVEFLQNSNLMKLPFLIFVPYFQSFANESFILILILSWYHISDVLVNLSMLNNTNLIFLSIIYHMLEIIFNVLIVIIFRIHNSQKIF